MMINKMLQYATIAVLSLLLPTASQAQSSDTPRHREESHAYTLRAATQADELQQLLEQLNPEILNQLYRSLSDKSAQLSSEVDNYLQCLEDQQAIAPSEPLDLNTFIIEALTTGKACQFLLDDLAEKLQQPESEEPQDNMDELLRQSL